MPNRPPQKKETDQKEPTGPEMLRMFHQVNYQLNQERTKLCAQIFAFIERENPPAENLTEVAKDTLPHIEHDQRGAAHFTGDLIYLAEQAFELGGGAVDVPVSKPTLVGDEDDSAER